MLFHNEFPMFSSSKYPVNHWPMTVGSRSTKMALGTCFPAPVSLKKVLKESSPPPIIVSEVIWPSGWMPCSRQYSSQHALPIWAPAWPTCMEVHSRCEKGKAICFKYTHISYQCFLDSCAKHITVYLMMSFLANPLSPLLISLFQHSGVHKKM